MRRSLRLPLTITLISCLLPSCSTHREEQQQEAHRIVATTPQLKPVTFVQQYVCQIHSQRHIDVRALEMGYLESIPVREGQQVEEGDLLFRVKPILYESKLGAENAEATLAQLEFNYTTKLFEDKVVSRNDVLLLGAKLAKAKAKARLAAAEKSERDVHLGCLVV